jgi:methionyl-tRNA formyltransferase
VLQPERIRAPAAINQVLSLEPGLIVVASFGQILPAALLDAPRHRALNLHPSLLPLYRGPSPVTQAILDGRTETGTTLMLMAPEMDSGPILSQAATPIRPNETTGSLTDRLADLSAHVLMDALPDWIDGRITPRQQNESVATYTRFVKKEDGLIHWERPAQILSREVRAYNPWPAAYTWWRGRQLRVLDAGWTTGEGWPGEVLSFEDGALAVGTGAGILLARELQLPGARPQPAAAFYHGHRDIQGALLGEEKRWS